MLISIRLSKVTGDLTASPTLKKRSFIGNYNYDDPFIDDEDLLEDYAIFELSKSKKRATKKGNDDDAGSRPPSPAQSKKRLFLVVAGKLDPDDRIEALYQYVLISIISNVL